MKKKVLLIDDELTARETVRYVLGDSSFNLIEAESPDEGVAILRKHPDIRVILLDLAFEPLGKLAGTAVLDALKEHADDYRVIVLTGHEDLLQARQAKDYRVFNYLPKSATEALRFSVDQAFRDLDRESTNRKVRFFLEVQKKLDANEGLGATLNQICRSIRATVGAYTCHIRVYNIEYGDYHLEGFAGAEEGQRSMFALPKFKGDHFSGQVVQMKEVVSIADLQNDTHFRKHADAALADKRISREQRRYLQMVRSAFLVPIFTGLFGDGVDAVLNVSADQAAFFDDERKAVVLEFATLASLTLTKVWLQRLRKEIHHDYSQISGMLNRIGQLKSPKLMEKIYDEVMQGIAQIVNPEVISIFRFNPATELIENVAEYRGGQRVQTPDEFYKPGDSFVGAVFQGEETIQLPDASGDLHVKPLDDSRYDHSGKEGYVDNIPSGKVEHYLGVPIRIGGKVRGVLRAMNKKSKHYGRMPPDSDKFCLLERGFSGDCRNALEITASHLAVAISNAELLADIDARNENLRLLVRAVAHEINNTSGLIPTNVAGIRMLIDPTDDRIGRKLSIIEVVAAQATEFANRIAQLSPQRMGERVSVDINDAVKSAVDTLDLTRIENSSQITRTLDLNKTAIFCDIYRLPFIRLIRDIMINAYQALQATPNPTITVSTAKGVGQWEGFAEVRVEDNGPGVKTSDREKIFDPTFSTKGKGGNGIGLWQARTQLDLVGGKIRVEGEFGVGATFVVAIPLGEAAS